MHLICNEHIGGSHEYVCGTRTVAPSVAATPAAAMTLPMSVLSQSGPETTFLPSPLAPTATIVAPVVVGLANA